MKHSNSNDVFDDNNQDNDLTQLSLTPDTDEVEKRQGRGSSPSSTPKERPSSQRARRDREDIELSMSPSSLSHSEGRRRKSETRQKQGGGSSAFTGFLFLLVLGLAGFSGWMFLQMEQLKQALTVKESEFETKVSSLGSQLSENDQTAASNVEDLQKTLKTHDSEIRKLWGVSYDTNKKAIAKNLSEIDSLSKNVTENKKQADQLIQQTNQKLTGLDKKLNQTDKKLAQTDKKLGSQQKETLAKAENLVDSKISSLNADISQSNINLDLQIQTLKEEIAILQTKDPTSSLNTRISTNEQAVKAIDASRVKLNRDMQLIKTQLNQYKQLVESLQQQIPPQ